jgi:hypothetical protein
MVRSAIDDVITVNGIILTQVGHFYFPQLGHYHFLITWLYSKITAISCRYFAIFAPASIIA